jgi:hypothetical protein
VLLCLALLALMAGDYVPVVGSNTTGTIVASKVLACVPTGLLSVVPLVITLSAFKCSTINLMDTILSHFSPVTVGKSNLCDCVGTLGLLGLLINDTVSIVNYRRLNSI